MNRIYIKIFAFLYIGFGFIELIARSSTEFCFRAGSEYGYPLVMFNIFRYYPLSIFLFILPCYSAFKILKFDFSNALKCGIIISLFSAISFYSDTYYISFFCCSNYSYYISPNIGYYLEIIPLIFFVISIFILIYLIKFSNDFSSENQK